VWELSAAVVMTGWAPVRASELQGPEIAEAMEEDNEVSAWEVLM